MQNRQYDTYDLEDPKMMHPISLENLGTHMTSADSGETIWDMASILTPPSYLKKNETSAQILAALHVSH